MTDDLRPVFDDLADAATALVGITDESRKANEDGLARIAERVDSLREVGSGFGEAIGSALREAITPLVPAQGEPGAPGRDGVDGKDGLPGRDGKNGVDGLDGIDGKDGPPGKQGVRGMPGSDGPRGKAGERGPYPIQSVPERDPAGRIAFVRQVLNDGSDRRLQVKRDTRGRFSELVEVSA